MKRDGWFRRLRDQCPGWHVWWSSGTARFGSGYWAAPGKPEAGRAGMHESPYKIGPYKRPQDLRAEMRLRYGAGDTCNTCNAPWELCGHRQPEREKGAY